MLLAESSHFPNLVQTPLSFSVGNKTGNRNDVSSTDGLIDLCRSHPRFDRSESIAVSFARVYQCLLRTSSIQTTTMMVWSQTQESVLRSSLDKRRNVRYVSLTLTMRKSACQMSLMCGIQKLRMNSYLVAMVTIESPYRLRQAKTASLICFLL